MWACKKFQEYLLGTSFKVETDHKPLVPLLSSKALDVVPVRVQGFRLRLMRFSFTIVHVPGKELNTADTLSRSPVSEGEDSREEAFRHEVKAYVNSVVKNLPATEDFHSFKMNRAKIQSAVSSRSTVRKAVLTGLDQ